jgi:hypothetical protein
VTELMLPADVTPRQAARVLTVAPRSALGKAIWRAVPHLPQDLAGEIVELLSSVAVFESELRVRVLRGLGLVELGLLDPRAVVIEDYGVVSRKVVTTVGAGYIVDAFQNLVELENMKFHGLGTGSTAEAVGDTALVTELTTEYTGNVRATGTTTEGTSVQYVTVATNTLDSGTPALREHGIFSASSAGVLLDRSLFASITLDGTQGDALQSTYTFTVTAGG